MRDYGRVHCSFWTSPTIRAMSEDGQRLAFYLLTTEHGNLLGAFRLPIAYVCEDIQWKPERVSKGFAELFRNGFATVSEPSKWVFIHRFLKWNPLENPNQAKSALKIFRQMPHESNVKNDVLKALKDFASWFEWPELEPFRNGFETLSKPVSVSGTVTVTVTEAVAVSADAKPPTSVPDPDDLPQIADWCVRAWTRCKDAKALGHWPDARIPRRIDKLRARRGEFATLEDFRAAFIDRLQRMSAAYSAPIGENKWCPSLPWLLEPNGWEKTANKPTPQQIASASRQAKPNEHFTENDPLLRGLNDDQRRSYLGINGDASSRVPVNIHASDLGDDANMGESSFAHPRRMLDARGDVDDSGG